MGAGSVVNVSFGSVEGQRLAQPGEFTHLHRDTRPLIDRIDTGDGVALGAFEVAGDRHADPHVLADQFGGVADTADAGVGVQPVGPGSGLPGRCRIGRACRVRRPGQVKHDGVVGTLLRGRGAVAGQVGAGFVGVLVVGAEADRRPATSRRHRPAHHAGSPAGGDRLLLIPPVAGDVTALAEVHNAVAAVPRLAHVQPGADLALQAAGPAGSGRRRWSASPGQLPASPDRWDAACWPGGTAQYAVVAAILFLIDAAYFIMSSYCGRSGPSRYPLHQRRAPGWG